MIDSQLNESQARAIPVVSIASLECEPHAVFRHYRREVPVIRREDGPYLVLRAADVASLYDETKTRQVETDYIRMRGISSGPVFDLFANTMLFSNGAVHKHRRAPVVRSFSFRVVEKFRPSLRDVANTILDHHQHSREMNLLDDFAALIPAATIASILGIPTGDIPYFTSLVYTLSRILTSSWTNEEIPAIEAAITGLIEYVEDLIRQARLAPGSGFISDFLAAVDAQQELSDIEAIMQILTLIVGGSDTTRNGITLQTSLLLQHPDQWQTLLRRPDIVPSAVEEALRFEPATGSVSRFAMRDIFLDGCLIPKHSVVVLMTISAMRDEQAYANPDVFDICRQQAKWLPVFGGGPHRCLGEALAKIELEETLKVLLERCPDLRVVGEYPRVFGHSGIRHVQQMQVAW